MERLRVRRRVPAAIQTAVEGLFVVASMEARALCVAPMVVLLLVAVGVYEAMRIYDPGGVARMLWLVQAFLLVSLGFRRSLRA